MYTILYKESSEAEDPARHPSDQTDNFRGIKTPKESNSRPGRQIDAASSPRCGALTYSETMKRSKPDSALSCLETLSASDRPTKFGACVTLVTNQPFRHAIKADHLLPLANLVQPV